MPVRLLTCLALVAAGATAGLDGTASAQTDGPAPGVVYVGRKGDAEVRMVRIGEASGQALLLLDVQVECAGFQPEGRGIAVVEDEEGRFEVEFAATEPGTTDVITGEFDDIDGKVRSDGAVLEIDIEVEGEDNAGSTGRCEETQRWRLDPQRNAAVRRIDRAVATDDDAVAATADAVFTLRSGEGSGGELTRVDARTLRSSWTMETSAAASSLAATDAAVWVLDDQRLEVTRHDPASGAVAATTPLERPEVAQSLTVVAPPVLATVTALWVAIDETQSLYRVDAATNEVTIATVPGRILALAPATDGVVASIADEPGTTGRLVHLSEQTSELQVTPLDAVPDALAADATHVWGRIANAGAAYDPSSLAPVGETTLGDPPLDGATIVAATPGAWTPTARGLALLDDAVARAGVVPVITAAPAAISANADAVFVIDAGYLIRIDAR